MQEGNIIDWIKARLINNTENSSETSMRDMKKWSRLVLFSRTSSDESYVERFFVVITFFSMEHALAV